MRRFHIKSLVLGIGIGIVFTSIMSMVYFAGADGNKSAQGQIVSGEEQQSKKPGSIFLDSNSDTNKKDDDTKKQIETKNEKADKLKDTKSGEAKVDKAGEEVKLLVVRGDTSESVAKKLLEAGLISDASAFLSDMSAMGVESKIQLGEYQIKKGSDHKTIIEAIIIK